MTSIRYIVNDTEPAIEFYVRLGFNVVMKPAPGFAMLKRDELRLLLNTPGGGGGAGMAMSDGTMPEPGGWNRFQIEVDNIEQTVKDLTSAGVAFRSDVISGNGGKQVIADDPSGNPIELFEPKRD